jgi:choloylglycine hydrolase
MRSSTIWTTGWDSSGKVLYFHIQHNRRVRKVEMDKIDFSKTEIVHIPLNEKKEQDIKDITPAK